MVSGILAGIENDPIPGVNPNRAARLGEAWRDQQSYYDLLFVEFDDQGQPFHREAITQVMNLLNMFPGDVIVLLFVHGWRHSARENDENVGSIHRLLHTLGHTEALRSKGDTPRRVVGIYVGWRGMSLHWAGILENTTFWGRKAAAMRVALGSVRELLARLRQFRLKARLDHRDGTRLIITGHSFGGLIVHAAISEYLVESAVTPNESSVVVSFGDMTILVNPAFEASRYYPLHSIVATKQFAPRQAPVFISVTAQNDWATGIAFPAGRLLSFLTESATNTRERQASLKTMGHIPWMKTHELTKSLSAAKRDIKLVEQKKLNDAERDARISQEDEDFRKFLERETGCDGRLLPGWTRTYTEGAQLKNVCPEPEKGEGPISSESPFWVVRASPDVVNGHNGIFGFMFLDFLRQVLDDAIRIQTPSGTR